MHYLNYHFCSDETRLAVQCFETILGIFFIGRHRIIFRDNLADENVLECHIRYRDHHQQGKRKSTKST